MNFYLCFDDYITQCESYCKIYPGLFFFTFIEIKGWYFHHPRRSCKDIRDSGDSKGDREYWIDPEKSGNPLKVFCDMTTDGGKLRMMNKEYCRFSHDVTKIQTTKPLILLIFYFNEV